ncbi:DNA-directed RNA polymerase I subunit rpa49 [Quaeritorhiza haematococci]|nr:DNA-directed RNA polymerase I subunit rpa49 [Quaeritorhiza haematococci]
MSKRQRDDGHSGHHGNSISCVIDGSENAPGACLVVGKLPNSSSLEFRPFLESSELARVTGTSNKPSAKRRRLLVAAETERLEVTADSSELETFCRYVVGVFDKRTKTLTFREVPVMPVKTCVKAQKAAEETRQISQKNYQARTALGQAFGTKKRKQQLNALEQNQVNLDQINSVADVLRSTIEEKSAAIPTKEEMAAESQANRLIPPHNMQASQPSEVYNIDDIAPWPEVKAVYVKHLLNIKFKADLRTAMERL